MKAVTDIDRQAAHWVARLDVLPRPAMLEAEFETWINADIRHRVAYLRHDAMWRKTQVMERLRPLQERPIDADLLAPASRRGWLAWRVAAAALMVISVALLAANVPELWGEQVYATGVGNYQRIYLQDGSSIEMNTDSKVRVRLTEHSRRVELLRGEAKFQVAHDANRPFDVVSAGNVVRAVGTAFSVRIRNDRRMEVLVTEGRVVVVPVKANKQVTTVMAAPRVAAGQAAIIAADAVTVEPLPAPVAARRLAWTAGKLIFDDDPLATAVAEFNRYNEIQLVVGNPAIGAVRVSGNFEVTNVQSFLAALQRVFAIHAEPDGNDTLVLVSDQSY